MHLRTGKIYDTDAPKARINMTINEDLLRVAREHTNNLSDFVEKLLASALEEERQKRAANDKHWVAVCASWNSFHETYGSIADEFNEGFLPESGSQPE